MTPQVVENNFDTFKHLSLEEKKTISSLNDLSGLYTGGFKVIEVEMVRTPILDVDQSYFWADDWQKDEQAIDEDYKKGEFKRFSNSQDAIAFLRG
ncbi:hypothetical protein HZC34_05170 [Candidatus Saganbacteria bacterium]|nr:hypothetical protein [Candidatus Saganbacteria bacterium]